MLTGFVDEEAAEGLRTLNSLGHSKFQASIPPIPARSQENKDLKRQMAELEEPREKREARQTRDTNNRQRLGIFERRKWAWRGCWRLKYSKIAKTRTAERCWRMVITVCGLPSASIWKIDSSRWRIWRVKASMMGNWSRVGSRKGKVGDESGRCRTVKDRGVGGFI